MFWKKETEEEKFNKNIKILINQKKWLDYNFIKHELFNSLLCYKDKDNVSLWVICRFELPLINENKNNKLRLIIKNQHFKEIGEAVLYINLSSEFELKKFLNDIISQREDFKEINRQLNLYDFEITKIEKNITEL